MTENYRNNGDFEILAGKQHFKPNGELAFNFKHVRKARTFHRTHYGFRVPHTGVVYGSSDHNLSLALRRLTGCREPDVPGAEETLRDNQRVHLASIQHVFRGLAAKYAPILSQYQGMRTEASLHHADPHEKRELRIRAYLELCESGQLARRHWMRYWRALPCAEAKMKTEEYAKPGKKPRMIVDLGVAASLQGFRLTEYLKQAQHEQPLHYKGGTIRFIKDPSPDTLQDAFLKLINPPGRFYFVYFSDDACYSVRSPTGVRMYNLDISSCDASHTAHLFATLVDLMPPHARDDMRILVEQCRAVLKIRSTANPKVSVKIRPRTPRLYSGSTITTAINNLANISIAVALVDAGATEPSTIHDAARRAGYIVTSDEATRPEELQFLKHSPCKYRGTYVPILNPGVLFRLSGTCKRDLPGDGPVKERALAFQKALLDGVYAGVSFPLLERMRANLPLRSDPASGTAVAKQLGLHPGGRVIASAQVKVTDYDVFARYSLDPSFSEHLAQFADVGYEEQFSAPELTTVLSKDYGLDVVPAMAPPPEEPCQPFSILLPFLLHGL